MAGNFHIEIAHDDFQQRRLRLLADSGERLVKDALEDLSNYAVQRLQFHLPKKTGNMAASVRAGNLTPRTVGGSPDPTAPVFPIGLGTRFASGEGWEISVKVNDPGATAVQRGSGVFGPSGMPFVKPQGNAFLIIKEGEEPRYRQSVKGQEGQHYLEKAAADLEPLLDLEASEMIAEIRAILGT